MKQEFKSVCECGKEIVGFSKQHLKKNLEIHKLISKEHKERINLIKNNKGEIIYFGNRNINQIADMLINHPFMIEDMKEIGRVLQNKEEREYEKKIMVS